MQKFAATWLLCNKNQNHTDLVNNKAIQVAVYEQVNLQAKSRICVSSSSYLTTTFKFILELLYICSMYLIPIYLLNKISIHYEILWFKKYWTLISVWQFLIHNTFVSIVTTVWFPLTFQVHKLINVDLYWSWSKLSIQNSDPFCPWLLYIEKYWEKY